MKSARKKSPPRRKSAALRKGGSQPRTPQAKADAVYLYCITPRDGGNTVAAAGVDGRSGVEAVRCGSFWCWISEVSRDEFAKRLTENMQNLEWLAAAGVRHQQVVAEIAGRGDVLPARFATVFLTLDSLRDDVKRRNAELRRNLERVRGCDEWGVKIHAVARIPAPQDAARKNEESGRGYLQRKSVMLESAMRMRSKTDPALEAFAQELSRLSRENVPAGAMSRGQPGVQWQHSYLIPRRNRSRLMQALERYSEKWDGVRRIECTGPWPPYSFVTAGEGPETA